MGVKSLVHEIVLVARQGLTNGSANVVLPLKFVSLSVHKDGTDDSDESFGRFGCSI